MNGNYREEIVGGVAMVVLASVLVFSYAGREQAVSAARGTYLLEAAFNRVDGLIAGDEVRLGGIRVGSVDSQFLDKDYRAVMKLSISSDVKLPTDTSAAIHTDGLFGSKYVVLEPGGEEAYFEDGDEISFTQDAVVVSDLLDLIIAEGRARIKSGGN